MRRRRSKSPLRKLPTKIALEQERRVRNILNEMYKIQDDTDLTPYIHECESFFKNVYKDPVIHQEYRQMSSHSPKDSVVTCGHQMKQWLTQQEKTKSTKKYTPTRSRSPFRRYKSPFRRRKDVYEFI